MYIKLINFVYKVYIYINCNGTFHCTQHRNVRKTEHFPQCLVLHGMMLDCTLRESIQWRETFSAHFQWMASESPAQTLMSSNLAAFPRITNQTYYLYIIYIYKLYVNYT